MQCRSNTAVCCSDLKCDPANCMELQVAENMIIKTSKPKIVSRRRMVMIKAPTVNASPAVLHSLRRLAN